MLGAVLSPIDRQTTHTKKTQIKKGKKKTIVGSVVLREALAAMPVTNQDLLVPSCTAATRYMSPLLRAPVEDDVVSHGPNQRSVLATIQA